MKRLGAVETVEKNTRPIILDYNNLVAFLTTELSRPESALSFFVGAGISKPLPSNLPTSYEIITGLINGLCIDKETESYRQSLSKRVIEAGVKLERVFEIIENNNDNMRELFAIFQHNAPNVYHYCLRKLIEKNAIKYMITTNFDQLIEKASRAPIRVLATDQEFSVRANQSIYKIHGTVERPDTMIAVFPQVSRGLSPNKSKVLREALANICLVIGWSDDDLDLTPPFLEDNVKGVLIWFSFKPNSKQVIDFSALSEEMELPKISPKVIKILKKRKGILVCCNPELLLQELLNSLEVENYRPTILEQTHVTPDVETAKFNSDTWFASCDRVKRLSITAEILLQIDSFKEASNLYEKAEVAAKLQIYQDLPQKYLIHFNLLKCAIALNHTQDVLKYLELSLLDKGYQMSANDFFQKCPENIQIAALYGNLARYLEGIGRIEDAVKFYRMDVRLCTDYRLPGVSAAYAAWANALYLLGSFQEAKIESHTAIALSKEEGNIDANRYANEVLAIIASIEGNWLEAESRLDTAMYYAEMMGSPRNSIFSLNNFAKHLCEVEKFEECLKYAYEALKKGENHGFIDNQADSWMIIGIAHRMIAIQQGYPLKGQESLQKSLQANTKALSLVDLAPSGNARLRSMILDNRGLLHWMIGDIVKAQEYLNESLKIRTDLQDEIGKAKILDNLALAILSEKPKPNTKLAEEKLANALAIYEKFGCKRGKCQVLNELGCVYLARLIDENDYNWIENRDQAITYFKQSLSIAKELNIPSCIRQSEENLKRLSD
jgi:tetratricopeptide (TPR) repeat protein